MTGYWPSILLMFGALIGALNVIAGLIYADPPMNPPSEPYRTTFEKKYVDPYR